MSAAAIKEVISAVGNKSRPVLVVGAGPVGMHVTRELLRHGSTNSIVQFGAEQWLPYNRVRLSSLLAGEINTPEILDHISVDEQRQLTQHHHCEIISIDRKNSCVIDRQGYMYPYNKLILAVGSSPHIPNIDGIRKPNIFTFRDMNDAQKLLARRVRSRRTVVIGGGLLGLEAARAMQKNNTEVMIIEHNSRLMQKQLDEQGAELLREHLFKLGMIIYLKSSVKQISNRDFFLNITLNNGKSIECDTIIVATGIKPNIDLARNAGLHVGRGITVNDYMQTCDPNIYAIGECAEHNGNVYGLVAPGLEQASIVADHIGGGKPRYNGSLTATQLKVLNRNVFSAGVVADDVDAVLHKTVSFHDPDGEIYRSITVKRNIIVGALAVGEWPEANRLQESILHGRRLYAWQLYRFKKTGHIWPEEKQNDISTWPAKTIVCNCKSVNRGELTSLCENNNCTLEEIARCTGASTVCGTCKPLIEQFIDMRVGRKSDSMIAGSIKPVLLTISLFCVLLTQVYFWVDPLPVSSSVQTFSIAILWEDTFWKQVSGYSLLGVTALGLLMSLRKRNKILKFGDFNHWRLFHVITGVLLLTFLVLHTGLQLGSNLNLMLMLSFLGIAVTGGLAAIVVALEGKLNPLSAKRARSVINYSHLLLFWPFPVLICFHIISFYYF